MGLSSHDIGDRVILKSGFTRTPVASRTCRIVGQLPASEGGDPQYRVRFEGENFERCIRQSDIEPSPGQTTDGAEGSSDTGKSRPWLVPASIRVRR